MAIAEKTEVWPRRSLENNAPGEQRVRAIFGHFQGLTKFP